MREWLARFMAGRYGMDAFGRFLNLAALILAVASWLTWPWLYAAALAVWLYAFWRMLSRNAYRRMEENRQFLRIRGKAFGWVNVWRQQWRQRKTHRFYRCPSCRNTLRVPRGKGKIAVTCPKCGTRFERQS